MTDTCACCGKPTDRAEEHHHNHRKGDNHPDNLTTRDRRCHMSHHENRAAVTYEYAPSGPSTGPSP